MGRKSILSEKQWQDIGTRLEAGEKASALAKEYGIDRAAISRKFSQQIATVKNVANQILAAEDALKSLPIAQQISAINLVDQLRSISGHLAGAANYGAATAHRLSGIAHMKSGEIDESKPLTKEGIESLQGIAVLTKMSNDAAAIGLNLLNANKDMAKPPPPDIPNGLDQFYGDA
jgi:hypothetical protein